MLLNLINNPIKANTVIKRSLFSQRREIAFKSGNSNDVSQFSTKPKVLLDGIVKLTDAQMNKLLDIEHFEKLSGTTTATTSSVYETSLTINGIEQPVAIKILKVGAERPWYAPASFLPTADAPGEGAILLKKAKIKEFGNKQQKLISVFSCNGIEYLVSTAVEGKCPNFRNNPFKPVHLNKMIDYSIGLDKAGLHHYDLRPDNLLIMGNAIEIIDFGGSRIEKPSLSFMTPSQQKLKIKNFNRGDNPFFYAPSNLTNFERRGIYHYMMEMPDGEQKQFFTDYLKMRGVKYNTQQAKFLKKSNQNKVINDIKRSLRPESKISLEIIKKYVKKMFDRAIRYEEITAKVLVNPSDNVIKAELLKIELKHLLHLISDGFSPNGIKEYYQNSLKLLNEMRESAKDIESEFFENSIILFKSFNSCIINGVAGSSKIDFSKLLSNKIFSKIH